MSKQAAEALIAKDGFNELSSEKPKTILHIIFGVFTEPMFLLLLGCAILYFILGEWKEACMLLFFVLGIICLTIYEERKTENALAALKKMASPRSLVVRDGVAKRIPSRELVRGDICGIYEGDRVPADGILLEGLNLSIDESILTGESFPVSKSQIENPTEDNNIELPHTINAHENEGPAAASSAGAVQTTAPGAGFQEAATGDAAVAMRRPQPFLYSGTLVVRGQGVMQIKATGPRTEFGRIGKMLTDVKQDKTPLEKETHRLVVRMLIIGLILCVIVTVVFGFTALEPADVGQRWLKGFLAGLALAMALLPEEFPVVMTVFMALGSWRIGQRKVLTRRPQAIETLGACTVLCTDKTGTLTMNKMELRLLKPVGEDALFVNAQTHTLPEYVHPLLEYGVLASQQKAFDPMDVAVKSLASQDPGFAEHLHENWSMLREYPPDEMMAVSRVYSETAEHSSSSVAAGSCVGETASLVVACKGAPESIADLCHLPEAQWNALREEIRGFAQQGLRLLAVARARFRPPTEAPPSPRPGDALPGRQHDFDFVLVGLLGFHDPIRPEVPEAVATCHRAGMKVVMITGDMPETALKIAREVGITNPNVVTGQQINDMNEMELRAHVKDCEIFARVRPEQKLKLVQAFKANGEITAMTGDGVNDSPALKAADIGIAMGERGTDVAREAAHLVLLDDSFSSIVAACQLGRRIFDNLTKAMGYIIIVHIPFAGLALLPVLFRWPMMLYPVHIVFAELVIDPCCSIVFEMEPEEPDILLRQPRSIKKSMVGMWQFVLYLCQGCGILACSLVVYWWQTAKFVGEAHEHSQALAVSFGILMIGNLGTVMTNRSQYYSAWFCMFRKNTSVWIVIPITLVALFLVIYVPGLRDLFHFTPISFVHVLIFIGAGLVTPCFYEVYKFFLRMRHGRVMNVEAPKELAMVTVAPAVQA